MREAGAPQPGTRQRIRRGNVNEAESDHPSEYDVVTAFDIIEHLEDPVAFLEEIAGMLSPGGGVVISTPDTGHVLRYLMGRRWPMLQPMQHTTLMSRLGLRVALDRLGTDRVRARVSLAGSRAGEVTLRVQPEQITVPPGVTVIRVNPSRLRLVLGAVRS